MKKTGISRQGAASSRVQAVRILLARFERRAPLVRLWQDRSFLGLQEDDQAFCREIVDAVLRNLALIDFRLGRVSRRPLKTVDPVVLWILRISAAQVGFLRTPDYAALDEAALLCREFRRKFSTSFVNGVLRGCLRDTDTEPEGVGAEPLAIRTSHPLWLVRRWIDRFGFEETDRLLRRNNLVPSSFAWVNPFRISPDSLMAEFSRDGVGCAPVAGLPGCVRLEGRGLVRHRLFRNGCCFLMDPSSQQVAHFGVIPSGPGRVGDLCAAPGGKAFILAARLGGTEPVVCCDQHAGRLTTMRQRAEWFGVPGLRLLRADLSAGVAPFSRAFRFLLADVPCSGSGTLRSNPDLRWFVREEQLVELARTQGQILRASFGILRAGGELVYSTCSTEPEENEEVVDRFLDSAPEAVQAAEPLRTFHPDAPGEGFYAVRIRRR